MNVNATHISNTDYSDSFVKKVNEISARFESRTMKDALHDDSHSGFLVYPSKKTIPLQDDKYISHNCKYKFSSSEFIVCRHISHAFLEGKIGTEENNYKKIQEGSEFEAVFKELGNNYDGKIDTNIAQKNYICAFDQIGETFGAIAENMIKNNVSKENYFFILKNMPWVYVLSIKTM